MRIEREVVDRGRSPLSRWADSDPRRASPGQRRVMRRRNWVTEKG